MRVRLAIPAPKSLVKNSRLVFLNGVREAKQSLRRDFCDESLFLGFSTKVRFLCARMTEYLFFNKLPSRVASQADWLLI
jgi:hypothetical protein